MFKNLFHMIKPKVLPPLDNEFQPAVLVNHVFRDTILKSKNGIPVSIVVEREDSSASFFRAVIFSPESKYAQFNNFYLERLIKTLLWIYGGHKIILDGPREIVEYIKGEYSEKGRRFFDAGFMSNIYGKPFTIVSGEIEKVMPVEEKSLPFNQQLKGCRIGFDLGASDRKVSAVIDGKTVFSEEVTWNPGEQANPEYHYHEIMSMLHRAAAHLPRVDAIGGSAAGVYIHNRIMVSSLFRKIPVELFEKRVKNIFLDIEKKWKVPFKVLNDGEVTALAGSMSLKVNAVLGIALGSSEAGGYVNREGNITTQLNELAFVPVDYNHKAPLDSWSNDYGCGVQYLSQMAVIRLAEKAGIIFDTQQTPAEKLKNVQELLIKGNQLAAQIFNTIGVYLGYAVAHYADFYDLEHILILGRVTSGEGGHLILHKANQVLQEEFKELSDKVFLHLPDESSRRIGQSIAAASLPLL